MGARTASHTAPVSLGSAGVSLHGVPVPSRVLGFPAASHRVSLPLSRSHARSRLLTLCARTDSADEAGVEGQLDLADEAAA